MQSIFTDVGKLSLQGLPHSAVIPFTTGQTGSPLTATSWLTVDGEAHYALASPAGGITLVTLPPYDSEGEENLTDLLLVTSDLFWSLLLTDLLFSVLI